MAFDISAMLDKYRQDHQHPVNRALHSVGIPLIVLSLPTLLWNPMLAAAMFIFGWMLQFIGHAFEGKMPSFFSDARFLMIGPMWLVRKFTGQEPAPSSA